METQDNAAQTDKGMRHAWLVYALTGLVGFIYFMVLAVGLLCLASFLPFGFGVIVAVGLLAAAVLGVLLARSWGLSGRVAKALGCDASVQWQPKQALALVLGLTVLALAVRLVMFGTHAIWHARFDALVRQAKAEGYPTSLADFQETYPDQDYAYPALSKALAKFDAKLLTAKPHPGINGVKRWTPAVWKDSHEAAAHYEALVSRELLPVVTKYRRFMKVDYLKAAQDPFNWPVPKFSNHISFGQVIRLGALDEAFQGRTAKAWERLTGLFALGDLVAQDRTLIAKMVAVGLRRMAAQAAITAMLNRPGSVVPKPISDRLSALQKEDLIEDGYKAELAKDLDVRDAYEPRLARGDLGFLSGEGEDPSSFEARSSSWFGRMAGWAGVLDIMSLSFARDGMKRVRDCKASDLGGKELEAKTWARMALLMSAAESFRAAQGRYPRKPALMTPRYMPVENIADHVQGRLFDYEARPDGRGYELCSRGLKGDRRDSRGEDFCVRQER